jgi:hypothetical protein
MLFAVETYTIDLQSHFGLPLPTFGSLDYDSSTTTFTDCSLVWDGIAYDLTAIANLPANLDPQLCINGLGAAAAAFQLMTNCSSAIWSAGGATLDGVPAY